jgi:hypothetical protein
VARILQGHGFDPGPKRGRGTWSEFVKLHLKTLSAPAAHRRTMVEILSSFRSHQGLGNVLLDGRADRRFGSRSRKWTNGFDGNASHPVAAVEVALDPCPRTDPTRTRPRSRVDFRDERAWAVVECRRKPHEPGGPDPLPVPAWSGEHHYGVTMFYAFNLNRRVRNRSRVGVGGRQRHRPLLPDPRLISAHHFASDVVLRPDATGYLHDCLASYRGAGLVASSPTM